MLVYYAEVIEKVGESIILPALGNKSIHVANHCGRTICGDWYQYAHWELGFLEKVFERQKNVLYPRVFFDGQLLTAPLLKSRNNESVAAMNASFIISPSLKDFLCLMMTDSPGMMLRFRAQLWEKWLLSRQL